MANIAEVLIRDTRQCREGVVPDQPTPLLYAQWVAGHSRRRKEASLFPGLNYKILADFLSQPYVKPAYDPLGGVNLGSRPLGHNSSNLSRPLVFAALHEYSTETKSTLYFFNDGQDGLKQFSERPLPPTNCAELLFFSGFASPAWLNLIGARHRVDPEFFRRHLDFRHQQQHQSHFDLPSLPSTSGNIIKLPIITIGSRAISGFRELATGDQGSLSWLRTQSHNAVKARLDKIYKSEAGGVELGTSLIRDLLIFDETHFAVEQEISICIRPKRGGWTGIIWLDCNQDLNEALPAPWLGGNRLWNESRDIYLPVYQYKPKMALRGHEEPNAGPSTAPENSRTSPSDNFQSANSIPLHYGRTLNQEVLRLDAFYALTELFSFCAFSENQLLNVIHEIVKKTEDVAVEDMQNTLANLQYLKRILDDHHQRQEHVIACIQTRGDVKWPRIDKKTLPKLANIAEGAAKTLEEDFQHVSNRTRAMSKKCSDEIGLLMNRAMLAESQRNLLQANRVARLTLLAFLFIPLSFTSSFFGMNFVELQQTGGPRLSLWVWFAVSTPVFIISLLICFWKSVYGYVENLFRKLKSHRAFFKNS